LGHSRESSNIKIKKVQHTNPCPIFELIKKIKIKGSKINVTKLHCFDCLK